jgi:hypothetical protein
MQHTSWFNETLNGAWLGQQPTELQARLMGSSVGSEMFSDPDLNNAAVWDVFTTRYVVTGGKAVRDNNANSASLRFATTLVVGTIYRVTVQLSSALPINVPGATGSGSLQVDCYVQGQAANATTALQTGLLGETLTFFIAPTVACNRIGINSGTSSYMDIEAVSLKAVTIAANNNNGYYQSIVDGKFYKLHKNQFAYSEQLDNAVWSKFQATVTTNVAVAPDGTTTADLVVPVVTNSQSVVRPLSSVNAGQIVTFSVYLKAAGYSRVHLLLADTGNSASANAFFDLTGSGVLLGTASSGASNITQTISLSNGWYRCSITAQTTGYFTGGGFTAVPSSVTVGGSFPTFTSDGTSGVHAWGAQLESGALATSYESKTVSQGTSEVFRGNKAKFPRLAAIVAESASVTIYDLTEAGRPMWMRFVRPTTTSGVIAWVNGSAPTITCVAALNGILAIGGFNAAATGLVACDFSGDRFKTGSATSVRLASGRTIAQRNGENVTIVGASDYTFSNGSLNAIAMIVMPDAPIDVSTGLQVPTIAVATNSSLSVVKHDGTVSNASLATPGSIVLTPTLVGAYRTGTSFFYFIVSPASALPTTFTLSVPTTGIDFFAGANGKVVGGGRSEILKLGSAAGDPVQKLKNNETSYVRGVTSRIAPTYNTGHLVGDIRRAYLAGVDAGAVSDTELVTNGAFDTDLSNWTALTGVTIAYANGSMTINSTTTTAYVQTTVTVVAGRTYAFKVDHISQSGGNLYYRIGNAPTGVSEFAVNGSATFGTLTQIFTATFSGTAFISLGCNAGVNQVVDNVSLREVIPDRSYKAAGAAVYGTLVKSPVA